MGRPTKKIDRETFEKLCALFCTLDDIASWFKCSPDTVERWCKHIYKKTFAETYKKFSAVGRTSLRRWQFKAAEKGNVTMLIFLGKNYLGQNDALKVEEQTDGKLADLIDGLKESIDDLHEETTGADGSMAEEQAEEA